MSGILRARRSRGFVCGVALVVVGLWAGLFPLAGGYFNLGYEPVQVWSFTTGRLWLEVVPAAAIVIGGIAVALSANRITAALGAILAVCGGVWLIIALPLSASWTDLGRIGEPAGGPFRAFAENLASFTGVGALAVFLAALALGRFAVIGVRDVSRPKSRRGAATTSSPTDQKVAG